MGQRERVKCTAVARCSFHAYVHVYVSGSHRHEFEGVDTCRTHVASVIAAAKTVSNDVRVRGTR